MKQIFILLLLSILIFSCGTDKDKEEYTTSDKDIIVTPTTLQYSTVYIGNSEIQEVTIKNIGNTSIKITKLEILYNLKNNSEQPQKNEFTVIDSLKLPFIVQSNDKIILKIKYTPTVAAKYDEIVLKIYNSASKTPIFVDIFVSDLKPQISVTPNTVLFSNIPVGSEVEADILIKNIGTANLIIEKDSLILSASDSVSLAPFENSAINNNTNTEKIIVCADGAEENNCKRTFKFKVKYKPESENQRSGSLKIKSNSFTGDVNIPIITSSSECVLSLYPQDDIINLGNRKINEIYSKIMVFKNNGQSNCNLDNIKLTLNQDNVFELTELPDFPKVLTPSERVNFKLNFTPTAEQAYTGKLLITGSDSNWENGQKEFQLSGNGIDKVGSTIAVCDLEYFEVEPGIDNENTPVNSIIILDGSSSYDINGGNLTFMWNKISGPEGSTAIPQTSTQAKSKYFVDITGSHKLKLTVTNDNGETDSCEVEAIGLSSNSLHMELFWDQPNDVNLHLRSPDGDDNSWFTNKDCYYSNCTTGASGVGIPCQDQETCTAMSAGICQDGACTGGEVHNPEGLEWGQPGREDNPRLDRYDMSGTGPEIINLQTPWDTGEQFYTVGVDFYQKNSEVINASVRIYCNGDIQYSGTANLEDTKWWWYVANVKWIGDGQDGTCGVTPINHVQNHNP